MDKSKKVTQAQLKKKKTRTANVRSQTVISALKDTLRENRKGRNRPGTKGSYLRTEN